MENYKEVNVNEIPECDMCGDLNGIYDARTVSGLWANMCPRCFRENDCRLGLGMGQKRILEEV